MTPEPENDYPDDLDSVSMWEALDMVNVPDEDKTEAAERLRDLMMTEWEQKAHENVEKWGLQPVDALLLAMAEEMGELAGEVHGFADYPEAEGEDARMAEMGRDLIRRIHNLGCDIRDYLEWVSEQDGEPVPPEDRPNYLNPFPEDLKDSRRKRLIGSELDDLMALGYQFQWALETDGEGGVWDVPGDVPESLQEKRDEHMDTAENGLYQKYTVLKDGEPQDGCYVLKPEVDPAARDALAVYAEATENSELETELNQWLDSLDADVTGGGS